MKLRQFDEVMDQVIRANTIPDCQECWNETEKWKQRFIGAVLMHSYGEDVSSIEKALEEL